MEDKRRAAKPKKLEEIKIMDITEKICDTKKVPGSWILKQDVVEKGSALKLEEQGEEGECGSECKTIERTCMEIMDYRDTDIAEALVDEEMTKKQLLGLICKDLSGACVGSIPPLPKDRVPGEKFEKKKPVDYAAMAREMGVKESVMHDDAAANLVSGGDPSKGNKKKGTKGKKKSNKGEKEKAKAEEDPTMRVLREANEVAKKGTKAAREWVAKVTNTPVDSGNDEL